MVDLVASSRVGRVAHHPVAGEQRQRAAAGGVDERGELVDHRVGVLLVARVGQVGGAVEEALLVEVERRADVEHVDVVGRDRGQCRARPTGIVALVNTTVSGRP